MKSLNHVARQISLMLHSLISQQIDDPNTRIVDLYPAYPEKIGNYVIEGFLGEGGMSYVYGGMGSGRTKGPPAAGVRRYCPCTYHPVHTILRIHCARISMDPKVALGIPQMQPGREKCYQLLLAVFSQ